MRTIILCIIILAIKTSVYAQNNEFKISFIEPIGDFSSKSSDLTIIGGKGSADFGFGAGYKRLFHLSQKKINGTIQAGFVYNQTKKAVKADFEYQMMGLLRNQTNGLEQLEQFDISMPKFIQIPLMVGLQYKINILHFSALYAEAGFGVNMLTASDISYTYSYQDNQQNSYTKSVTTNCKPSFNVAYNFTFGYQFRNRYFFDISFQDLGNHVVRYQDLGIDYTPNSMHVTCVNMGIGYRF